MFENEFREALVAVWGSPGREVSFTVLPGLFNGNAVSLSYDRFRARARGRELLGHASNHVLNVADRLRQESPELVLKLLLHEAIHVGYPEHDDDFRAVAVDVGTNVTEREMKGLGVLVERELADGTFQEVTTLGSLADAKEFAQRRAAGPGRYRLTH